MLDNVLNIRYDVNIDSSLYWKDHVKVISSKVSRASGFLTASRAVHGLTTVLYNTLPILSLLSTKFFIAASNLL